MLRLANLHKSYPGAGEPVHVLKGVDLTVETGELVSIMGSSGSGKSTLLNVLGLLDGDDDGTYHLDGALMAKLSEAQIKLLNGAAGGSQLPLNSLAVNMTIKLSDYGTPVTIQAPPNPQPTKALGGALLGAMFSMTG